MRSEAERDETDKRSGRMRKDSALKLIARQKEPRRERRDRKRNDSNAKTRNETERAKTKTLGAGRNIPH